MAETTTPTFSYDEDADILYISFAPGEKATAAVELNDNILLRFNRDSPRAIGLTLMDFSVLVQPGALGARHFPLSGLADLEPDWQEIVLALLMQPPVCTSTEKSIKVRPMARCSSRSKRIRMLSFNSTAAVAFSPGAKEM